MTRQSGSQSAPPVAQQRVPPTPIHLHPAVVEFDQDLGRRRGAIAEQHAELTTLESDRSTLQNAIDELEIQESIGDLKDTGALTAAKNRLQAIERRIPELERRLQIDTHAVARFEQRRAAVHERVIISTRAEVQALHRQYVEELVRALKPAIEINENLRILQAHHGDNVMTFNPGHLRALVVGTEATDVYYQAELAQFLREARASGYDVD